MDTHLHNPSGLDIAKRIRSQKPNQKLVLVTTSPKENLQQECLKTAGILDRIFSRYLLGCQSLSGTKRLIGCSHLCQLGYCLFIRL